MMQHMMFLVIETSNFVGQILLILVLNTWSWSCGNFIITGSSKNSPDEHTSNVTHYFQKLFLTHSYELSIKPTNNGCRINVVLLFAVCTALSETMKRFENILKQNINMLDRNFHFRSKQSDVHLQTPNIFVYILPKNPTFKTASTGYNHSIKKQREV